MKHKKHFSDFYRSSTPNTPTEIPDQYQTTKTNYNYHPIMEYFVPQTSSSPDSHAQDVIQRKVDSLDPVSEYHQTSNRGGWMPMSDDFRPRKLT